MPTYLAKGFAQQRPLARTLLNSFKLTSTDAPVPTPGTPSSDAGLTYYAHMKANFGMRYPKGWEVQEYDNAVDFRSGEGYFVEVDWISANVLGERSLAQYVLERAQDRVGHDRNAVVSEPKTNPNGSVTIEMEFLSGGQPVHHLVQSLEGEGGLLYTITFADSASGYAQHHALAIEMMNSFGEAKG